MSRKYMPPEETTRLLHELLERAANAGISGQIRVVGGAAVAIMNPERRTTTDIDAVMLPLGAFDRIVDELQREHDLDDKWLNDSAKAFIPLADLTDWVLVHQVDSTGLYIAVPEMLLAMKLFANRVTRDWDDIHFLLAECQVTSLEQAQEIYERYHAQDVIPESAVVRLQAWLDSRHSS